MRLELDLDEIEERRLFVTRDEVERGQHIIVDLVITPGPDLTTTQAASRVAAITSMRSLPAVPYETTEARIQHGARIIRGTRESARISVAYPMELNSPAEGLPQLLALLWTGADYYYTNDYWIEDIHLPAGYIARYRGPQFGTDGLRDVLGVGANRVPLGLELKPRHGVDPNGLFQSAWETLLGGFDFLIDDLLLVDPEGPLSGRQRIPLLVDLTNRASQQAGEKKSYFANVGKSPFAAAEMADFAIQAGVDGLLLNAMTIGFPGAEEIVRYVDGRVPVLTSNLGGGVISRPNFQGEAHSGAGMSEVVISKISRLSGFDGVNAGTSNSQCFEQEAWGPAVYALSQAYGGLKDSFAIGEGDLDLLNVWENIKSLGPNVLFELCSGVHNFPGGHREAAYVFRKLVDTLHPGLRQLEAVKELVRLGDSDARVGRALEYYGFDPAQQP